MTIADPPTRRLWWMAIVLAVVMPSAAHGQAFDLIGQWSYRNHEDVLHRTMPGPDLGDYSGLPLNDAARQKALSWDPIVLSQLERQAQPHPAVYSSRGPGPALRISPVIDPTTQTLIGYHFSGYYGGTERTVWMDGRPHPSARYGEHTWAGFSTGQWVDGRLVVSTTHIKMGVVQRNGSATSPYARMTEVYSRHGDMLTQFSWVDDAIYLEEPMVRTQQWFLQPGTHDNLPPEAAPLAFEPVEEVADKPEGWVAHYPLGTQHPEYAEQHGIPYEAMLGGRDSLYPEYMKTIERLRREAGPGGR